MGDSVNKHQKFDIANLAQFCFPPRFLNAYSIKSIIEFPYDSYSLASGDDNRLAFLSNLENSNIATGQRQFVTRYNENYCLSDEKSWRRPVTTQQPNNFFEAGIIGVLFIV